MTLPAVRSVTGREEKSGAVALSEPVIHNEDPRPSSSSLSLFFLEMLALGV